MATATQLANDYIKANKYKISTLPSHYVTSTGRLTSYNPVKFCANDSSYRRSYSDFRADNNAKEWMLLWVITHLKKELRWHLDHITPLSKGGTNNVKNLRILPSQLNTGIGNLGLNNDELNEFINCLTPALRKKFGIPYGFRACTLKEFCKEYSKWI